MGLRYFELGLDFFMRRGIRIVFMFDEFEDMLKHLPVKFFQTLRGLRDTNKRQLSYLTFTRASLPVLIEQYGLSLMELEPFIELFTDNICYVGPYNEADARQMIENLIGRNQRQLSDQSINFLLWSTGSYAGLIRAGFRLLDMVEPIDSNSMMNDEVLRKMILRRPMRTECKTIWTSLTPAEQHVLKAVSGLIEYTSNAETEQAVAMLVQKHLLRVEKATQMLHIEPPVFRVYITASPDAEML
jgi:hypothetical protein